MKKNIDAKISLVLVSPCRVDILNNVAKKGAGSSLEEISNNMISQSAGIQDHIRKLLEESILEKYDNKYYFTNDGKQVYKTIQQIISKAIEA